ncbi:MAG: phosphoglucomutase/phosphomannomutase family protein [Dehalococcoidia bacterium]
MTSPIKFGTDGWRAIIAEDFTFDNVRACAQSVVQYLRAHGLAGRGLVVGYDTRFASEDFAAAVAEVAAGNGIKAYLCDRPAPTPTVSYSVLRKGAGGAAVITASHNPARWNGFKYKPEYAGSASPEVVAELEAAIPRILAEDSVRALPLAEAEAQGLVERFDPRPAYLEQMGRLVELERIRSAGLRVVVDSMYGVGAGYLAGLLAGGRTEVREVHAERNPLFPGLARPEPIAENLSALSEAVVREGADVGIASDGDADRLGVVDENGSYIDQLQTFGLIVYHLLEVRGERGPIVKSITTTRMVQRLGELYGVPVHETAVGFKFLGPKMMEVDALIAGEESGGYAFRGHLPERDGILAALYFLDFMARTGKRPSQLLDELYRKVGPHYYDRLDLRLPEEEREDIYGRVRQARPERLAGLQVTGIDTTDGFRFLLEDGGWLLLRFSGTEPLLRIYTEVGERALVPRLLEAGKELTGVNP